MKKVLFFLVVVVVLFFLYKRFNKKSEAEISELDPYSNFTFDGKWINGKFQWSIILDGKVVASDAYEPGVPMQGYLFGESPKYRMDANWRFDGVKGYDVTLFVDNKPVRSRFYPM